MHCYELPKHSNYDSRTELPDHLKQVDSEQDTNTQVWPKCSIFSCSDVVFFIGMHSNVKASDKHAISVTQSIAGWVRECVWERERERELEETSSSWKGSDGTITNSLRKRHFVAGREWKYLGREKGLDNRVTNIERERERACVRVAVRWIAWEKGR